MDAHAERAQELLGDRAAGHAGRGLAGAGALEHVANVGQPVLLRSDQVRVPGPRQVDLGDRLGDRPRVHPLLPVGVVAVDYLERDRAAERTAVTDAAGDLGLVALDLHPPAAAVAELAAAEVAVDRLTVELEAGRQTFDDAGQTGAMRLARGRQVQAHAVSPRQPGRPRPAPAAHRGPR